MLHTDIGTGGRGVQAEHDGEAVEQIALAFSLYMVNDGAPYPLYIYAAQLVERYTNGTTTHFCVGSNLDENKTTSTWRISCLSPLPFRGRGHIMGHE